MYVLSVGYVSLDMDLYDPICCNSEYKGARQALMDFSGKY